MLLPPAVIVLKAFEAPPPLAEIVILSFDASVAMVIPVPATKSNVSPVWSACNVL